ncbi:MAG: LPS-assembly protein LptD [Proteobacteria bacterium]|nr:LPS-assembly protein LptD [Pseudomonadota bacterium]
MGLLSYFKYILSLLFLLGVCISPLATFAQNAEQQPISMTADKFSYSDDGEEIIATGNVKVISESGELETDKLVVNQKADKVYAIGNVIYLDTKQNEVRAEQLELTGDFKKGIAKFVRVNFADSTAVLTSDSALKISKTKINLYDTEYTSCEAEEEGDILPWQINADKVSYDAEKEEIVYKDVVFDFFNMPILYMPYFSHTTNSKKPVSGFTTPDFISSSANGFGFKLGYFFAIDENQDATISTKYLGKRGVILGTRYRYVGSNLYTDINLEGLEDKEDNEHARGLLNAEMEYVFEKGVRAGLNTKLVSDNDYLDEFKDKTDAYAYSTLYAERSTQNSYLGVSSRFFQDLRSEKKSDTTAQPLARVEGEKIIKLARDMGEIKVSADVLSLTREVGQDSKRLATRAEYIKPFYSEDGSLFELTSSLRADYYIYDEGAVDSSRETATRVLPEISLSWEKPYISSSAKHVVSPKLMFITSPEKTYASIPNEDSTSFELDATNLFEINRFSGWDKVETGNRLVYGIDSKYGPAQKLSFHGFIGQSYNFSDKEEDIIGSATSNNKNSDWVGFFKINPKEYLSFGSSFRLDSATFATQRMDSYVTLEKDTSFYAPVDLEQDYVKFVHSFLKDSSEEFNTYAVYNLNDKIAFKGRIQRDMFTNNTLLQEVDTIYKSGCYDFAFKVRKRGANTSDTESLNNSKDSLDFLFNFSIHPMGRKTK